MDRKILYTAPPKAAWKKELGDVDWDKTYDTLGNMSGICGDKNQSKADRTTVGIPLGGFGAGNFEYNITGTFGPWQMEPSILERRYLATAAFHAREEIVDTVSGDIISKKAATLAATGKLEGSANHLHPSWERHFFDEQGLKKLPIVKSLQAEYAQLLSEKKAMYADYQKAREDMRSLQTAKANVDRILGDNSLTAARESEKDGR